MLLLLVHSDPQLSRTNLVRTLISSTVQKETSFVHSNPRLFRKKQFVHSDPQLSRKQTQFVHADPQSSRNKLRLYSDLLLSRFFLVSTVRFSAVQKQFCLYTQILSCPEKHLVRTLSSSAVQKKLSSYTRILTCPYFFFSLYTQNLTCREKLLNDGYRVKNTTCCIPVNLLFSDYLTLRVRSNPSASRKDTQKIARKTNRQDWLGQFDSFLSIPFSLGYTMR